MRSLLTNIRYNFRLLMKSPGFTIVAVLTLALGIGANSAIFSVVDAVLLEPLPFKDSSHLLAIRGRNPVFPDMSVSLPDYYDWRAQNHTFEYLAALRPHPFNLIGVGEPELIEGQQVTANLFPLLGISPLLGRPLNEAEDTPAGPKAVVLSYALWNRRFGSDPNWVGRSVNLDGELYIIVGVMPKGFALRDAELWVSLGVLRNTYPFNDRGDHPGITALGRPKPGVSIQQATAELEAIEQRLAKQYPDRDTNLGVNVQPYLDHLVGNTRQALIVLILAVGAVLLIACANVANLLLARATGRQREFAVRMAMGAPRGRLISESLIESTLPALGGGTIGLLLANVCVAVAPSIIPPDIPRAASLALNEHVFVFTFVLCLFTALLSGLIPAMHATAIDPGDALKESGRSVSAGVVKRRFRNALITAEVCLALVLVVAAGLLLRSFALLLNVNPGFDPNHVLTAAVSLQQAKYPKDAQIVEFFQHALDRMKSIPGVQYASVMTPLPFSGDDWEEGFQLPDRARFPHGSEPQTDFAMASPEYFNAMRMTLLQGRMFNQQDTDKSPPVAIIDNDFARKYWPNQSPIGKQISLRDGKKVYAVVGVVKHVINYGLNGESRVEMFVPYTQQTVGGMYVVLRSADSIDPVSLTSPLKRAIQAVDADQPVFDVVTMDHRIALSLAPRRLGLVLIGMFGALAITLAAIGIYGVLSYSVEQRTHEIGIRMALGAQSSDVSRLVVLNGMRVAFAGSLLGLLVSAVLWRALTAFETEDFHFLYGVSSRDPITMIAVLGAISAVAFVASYLPARRASRMDPLAALRVE